MAICAFLGPKARFFWRGIFFSGKSMEPIRKYGANVDSRLVGWWAGRVRLSD